MPNTKNAYCGGIVSVECLRKRSKIDDITGCWHWSLSTAEGAAVAWIKDPASGERIKCRGPRAAWMLKKGCRLPKGWVAFLTCESIDCVNPDHTSAGDRFAQGAHIRKTQSQKGNLNRIRANRKIARAQPKTKLSPEKAREIRSSGKTQRTLAAEYGVAQNTIHAVLSGKTWREFIPGASIFGTQF